MKLFLVVVLAGLTSGGCAGSDRVEVTGRVTRKDGSPLVAAKVAFRSPDTGKTAIGYTDAEGRYQLGTSKVGEGLPPGNYYVTVFEDRGPPEKMRPRTIQSKYEAPQMSGLTFNAQPGGETVFDMALDTP